MKAFSEGAQTWTSSKEILVLHRGLGGGNERLPLIHSNRGSPGSPKRDTGRLQAKSLLLIFVFFHFMLHHKNKKDFCVYFGIGSCDSNPSLDSDNACKQVGTFLTNTVICGS